MATIISRNRVRLNHLVAYKEKTIRRTLHNDEWRFSVSDIVEALTDSVDVRQYIKKLRKRDTELNSKWGTICTPVKLTAPDGKTRKTNCANTEGIFRIIQSSPSARVQWWDYGWNGACFITICTQNRESYFGEILNRKKMALSAPGQVANAGWYEIPAHFPFVELGNFVVMPNHIHGILIIDKPDDENSRNDDANVETRLIASLPSPSPPPKQQIKTGGAVFILSRITGTIPRRLRRGDSFFIRKYFLISEVAIF